MKPERREEYNRVWTALEEDERVSAIMQKDLPLKGDEHKELEVKYNAKALFNIIGLMFHMGCFSGFGGLDPFAAKATQHYDKETNVKRRARRDYFNPEGVNIEQQFVGLTADEINHVKTLLSKK